MVVGLRELRGSPSRNLAKQVTQPHSRRRHQSGLGQGHRGLDREAKRQRKRYSTVREILTPGPPHHQMLPSTLNIADPQALEGLVCSLRHHRIRVLGESFERGAKRSVAAIPHGDGDIPQQAGVFRSPQRCATKPCAKLGFGQGSEFLERRGKGLRLKTEIFRLRSATVPWADVLADVAAEDVVCRGRLADFPR